MAEGDLDPFEFILAEALGKHLHEIRELPNCDIAEWAAFFSWRQTMEAFELAKAKASRD